MARTSVFGSKRSDWSRPSPVIPPSRAPRCAADFGVSRRPCRVRARKPIWSRKGSTTSSSVPESSPNVAAIASMSPFAGTVPRLADGGQEQAHEQGDDRDDHQQLDDGEAPLFESLHDMLPFLACARRARSEPRVGQTPDRAPRHGSIIGFPVPGLRSTGGRRPLNS